MKRSIPWIVLSAIGCAAKVTGPMSKSASDGPTTEGSASVDPVASASVSSEITPKRPRPLLTDSSAKAAEEILGGLCPIHYVALRNGGYSVACASCSIGSEDLDTEAYEVDAPLSKTCTIDPSCAPELPEWGVLGMTKGSFLEKGSNDVFLKMGGACNPKHTGFVLARKIGATWTSESESYARDLGACHALRRDDGRDILACVTSIANVGYSSEVGEVLGFRKQESAVLFSIPHQQGKYACFASLRHGGKPHKSSAPERPGWVTDAFVESSQVKDTNLDGRPDLIVDLVDKSSPAGEDPDEAAYSLSEHGEITGHHRLVFVNDGSSLKPDVASRLKIKSWCPEPLKDP